MSYIKPLKLSKKAALILTHKMWSFLAKHGDEEKFAFFSSKEGKRYKEPVNYECYLCDYSLSKMPEEYQRIYNEDPSVVQTFDTADTHCSLHCPLAHALVDEGNNFPCEDNSDSPYKLWQDENYNDDLAKKHAQAMVDIMLKCLGKPAIDTVRILLFKDCNLKCSYCCNNQEQFNSQFTSKYFSKIDFSKYDNVCVTGGEPFLKPDDLFLYLSAIPKGKNIYIYTNGLLVTAKHLRILASNPDIKGINVGIHSKEQLSKLPRELFDDGGIPKRFAMNEHIADELLRMVPEIATRTKTWIMDECNMPNEDWILVKHED